MSLEQKCKPCKTCPYRREPELLGHWAESEYTMLLGEQGDSLSGFLFFCHTHGRNEEHLHRLCTGWLLEQRRYYEAGEKLPIILMMYLTMNERAAAQFEAASDEGLDLFKSTDELCEANFFALKNADT